MRSQTEEQHSCPASEFEDPLRMPTCNTVDRLLQPFLHLRSRNRRSCVAAVPASDIKGRIGRVLISVIEVVPDCRPLADLFFLPLRLLRGSLLPAVFIVSDHIPSEPLF